MPTMRLPTTGWRNPAIAGPVVAVAAIVGAALYYLFAQTSIPDIGLDSQRGTSMLQSAWAKGEVIVLVRHMERCDRTSAACLDDPDGITVRGRDIALAAGEAFERLGVHGADVFTSPITRTKQTAASMFKTAAIEQEWLANCKTITIEDIARRKNDGRNLVLVTHNHCIEKIERDIRMFVLRDPAYGSLLFMTVDGNSRMPKAAATMDAERFIVSFRPTK